MQGIRLAIYLACITSDDMYDEKVQLDLKISSVLKMS